jgi:hypothetical protein
MRAARRAGLVLLLGGVLAAPRSAAAATETTVIADPSFVSVPTPATSAGLVYRYDPTTAAFVRESEIAGQIYLERPVPIGIGRWNVSVTYQWFDFGRFDFRSTDKPRTDESRRRPRDTVSTTIHQLSAAVTYGVTTNLDVNLTVPVLYVDSETVTHGKNGSMTERTTRLTVDPIFLRFKYKLVDRPAVQLATGLVVRLSTQTLFDSHVLSIGRVQPGLFFYGSRERMPVGHGMYLQPYVNLGADGDETGTGSVEAKWGVGLDWTVNERLTTAVAMLGYHRPFVSKDEIVFELFNASIGARVSLWQDRLVGFVNLLVPINRSASPIVPLAGLEITL